MSYLIILTAEKKTRIIVRTDYRSQQRKNSHHCEDRILDYLEDYSLNYGEDYSLRTIFSYGKD